MIVTHPVDGGLEWAKDRLEITSATERPILGETLVAETGAWPGVNRRGSSSSDRVWYVSRRFLKNWCWEGWLTRWRLNRLRGLGWGF